MELESRDSTAQALTYDNLMEEMLLRCCSGG